MTVDFIVNGLLFASAIWVGIACVRRLNLMHWTEHEPLVIVSYMLIGLWAASYVLGIEEVHKLGIAAIALLFFAGRKRWLSSAPPETRLPPAQPTVEGAIQ